LSYRAGMVGRAELELVAAERRARETRLRLRLTATVQRELEECRRAKGLVRLAFAWCPLITIGATQCPCTELRCTV
jgi:hypothetical protein